jgi:hypothetical protein
MDGNLWPGTDIAHFVCLKKLDSRGASDMKKIMAFVAGFSLMVLCALAPVDAAAQGRGNGRGNNPGKGAGRAPVMGVSKPGNPNPGSNPKRDWKKSRKFVNGHDARDGKWGKPGRGRGRGNGSHGRGHHKGHHRH